MLRRWGRSKQKFYLPHRRSTTVSLETRNPFTTQPLRLRSSLATPKLTMPNLKTLTKELRQEIVSYLYPLPSISSNFAFRLAIHIFTKTRPRYSSHINFISRCLQHKVIPKGFRSNSHASIFSNVFNFNLKYLHEIQLTQKSFSRNKLHSL